MRINYVFLLTMSIIILVGAGCSGINANGSVSPLSFFLPGFVQAAPKSDKTEKPVSSTHENPIAQLAQSN